MIKNACWRLLLKIIKPFQKKRVAKADHFLIVSTTGLGDTLWATPAIRSLKESFPSCQITALTSSFGKQVLDQNPHIDSFIVLSDPIFPKIWKMRNKGFSHAILFHTSQRSVLPFLSILQIPIIIGTKGMQKGLDDLLTKSISLHPNEHEIERRLRLIEAVGAKKTSTKLEMFLTLEEQTHAKLQKGKPLIILHPGAKDKFKCWPKQHFISAAKEILEKFPAIFMITGNKEEQDLCNDLAKQIPGAISVAGTLSLRETAALLKQAWIFITNDTGPMHMAISQEITTIALFSPTNHQVCGPYQVSNVHVISKKPTCTPCLKKKCQNPFCMMQIHPKEIVNFVIKEANHEKSTA